MSEKPQQDLPEPRDLTIYRSTTSNHLRVVESDPEEFGQFPLFIRLFIVTFTITSFILFATPTTNIPNGLALDVTVNISVLSPLNMETHQGGAIKVTEPSVIERAAKYIDESETRLSRVPSAFRRRVRFSWLKSLMNPNNQSSMATIESASDAFPDPAPLTSVLGVPALFGRVFGNAVVAPLAILNIDACEPFRIDLPQIEVDLTPPFKSKNSLRTGGANTTLGPKVKSGATLKEWFALVPRGNCPFDVKIYNSEKAGLAGCIIYNYAPDLAQRADSPVRMSANEVGGSIKDTHAIFITHADGKKLVHAIEKPNNGSSVLGQAVMGAMLATFSLDAWPRHGWVSGHTPTQTEKVSQTSMSDLAILLDILALASAICLVIVFGLLLRNHYISRMLADTPTRQRLMERSMARRNSASDSVGTVTENEQQAQATDTEPRNMWTRISVVYNRFRVFNYFDSLFDDEITAALLEEEESNSNGEKYATHDKVTLPIRIITANHIARSAKVEKETDVCESDCTLQEFGGMDCCAICIDEFIVGSRVRRLPCNHQFHDTCIDPWLINHNRLCPVCKQDVLAVKVTSKKLEDSHEESSDSLAPPAPLLRTPTINMEEGGSSNELEQASVSGGISSIVRPMTMLPIASQWMITWLWPLRNSGHGNLTGDGTIEREHND